MNLSQFKPFKQYSFYDDLIIKWDPTTYIWYLPSTKQDCKLTSVFQGWQIFFNKLQITFLWFTNKMFRKYELLCLHHVEWQLGKLPLDTKYQSFTTTHSICETISTSLLICFLAYLTALWNPKFHCIKEQTKRHIRYNPKAAFTWLWNN